MLSAISIRKRWHFVFVYLINEELVNSDVHVSIDGAQIETNEKTHFDIRGFLKCEGWIKEEDSLHLFYGTYSKLNYKKNWNSNFAKS